MSVIWKDGYFLDGTVPQLFHNDTGFYNGLGVFDSMLAENGVLIDAKMHFDRLIHDAKTVMGIGEAWLPLFSTLTEAWLPLIAQNRLSQGHARIKTIITGGVSDGVLRVSEVPSVVVTAGPIAAPENFGSVRCAIVHGHPRIAGSALENCKRLDYTRSFAARRAAQARGAEEAIITNTNGDIACAATSNLFIREGGRLITPPLSDGVLAGITRRKMVEDGGAVEESISEDRLRRAQEIILTNSFTGMRNVVLID